MRALLHDGHIGRHGAVVSWGTAGIPVPNELQSGDLCVVQPSTDGALIAVVDGAGHGVEAAAAAQTAGAILEARADESPVSLVIRCHDELKGGRGAAMTVAFLNLRDRTLTWLGVGNVEAVLFHASTLDYQTAERVILRSGLVGYRLPSRLSAEVIPLRHQDTLVMATDGIAPEFAERQALDGHPQHIAERILSGYGRGRDDALVTVARYLQGAGS